MQEPLRVWLSLDPEQGVIRILLNSQPIGLLLSGKQVRLDPQFAELKAITPILAKLFSRMSDTLQTASYEINALRAFDSGSAAAKQIPAERRARVQMGCGPHVRPGWLNIDYRPDGALGYDAEAGFLNFDLRGSLPLPDASVDLVFSSHFFEHILHHHAISLLKDIRRTLKPGGAARFQMPDYEIAFRAYTNRDQKIYDDFVLRDALLNHMPAYARGWGDLMSRAIFEFYEHKYIWDRENLPIALKVAGFSAVTIDTMNPEIDNVSRDDASFYVHAIA